MDSVGKTICIATCIVYLNMLGQTSDDDGRETNMLRHFQKN